MIRAHPWKFLQANCHMVLVSYCTCKILMNTDRALICLVQATKKLLINLRPKTVLNSCLDLHRILFPPQLCKPDLIPRAHFLIMNVFIGRYFFPPPRADFRLAGFIRPRVRIELLWSCFQRECSAGLMDIINLRVVDRQGRNEGDQVLPQVLSECEQCHVKVRQGYKDIIHCSSCFNLTCNK